MSSNTIVLLILSFVFFVSEYFFTYKKTNLMDRLTQFIKDIPFYCFNTIIPAYLIKTIFFYYISFLHWASPGYVPLLEGFELSAGLLFFIGFLISDFVGYMTHRFWYHKKLWILHRMHHSSKVVRWHSSFRFNPLELALTTSLIYIIYSLLGIPKYLFYDLLIFNYFINYMAHSELPIGNKYIEKILVTPNYHRVHHSVDINNQRSNYAGVFTIWDRMFCSVNNTPLKNIKLGIK
ncbi:MAG: hypothetical protein CME67_02805 [Halobacteriovoraceae bacterium]|nr:hypothetical protein [Halobacteriovoraceae bacterium]|tara:strand:- start:1202 stop:1906 length:705 start_codon:yes stop_codon:yes gene_type:complete